MIILKITIVLLMISEIVQGICIIDCMNDIDKLERK